MLTLVIKDSGEPNVIKLTYENIYKEIKDIAGAELLVADHWGDAMGSSKNRYICYLEADCLVSSGYFTSQMGLFKKNPKFRKLSMMSSATGVNNWANKFYGYSVGSSFSDGVIPVTDKKSSRPYMVQIGFIPGAIIRKNMLIKALGKIDYSNSLEDSLVRFSTSLSFEFWRMGDGNPVFVNPNSTYVTTDDTANDIGRFDSEGADLVGRFKSESI